MNKLDIETIDWQKVNNLVPVIVQNSQSAQVLMLGYMNKEALQQTLQTKKVTFFSRTKQRLWVKGETSGDYLELQDIMQDCDNDSLLILANPIGPTCHKGSTACFANNQSITWQHLYNLETTIKQRFLDKPKGSYTTELINKGINTIAQKVGEEATETVIAALNETNQALCNEAADLIFHLLVLLNFRGLLLVDVIAVLMERANK